VAVMVLFTISDSLGLDIEPICDVHQANGNKLQKLDGCGTELDDRA
jgi:hypothetical protein